MLSTKAVAMIDVADWDELVEETYDKVYSFQQQDDCKPRGTYKLTVPSTDLNDFENDTVPEIVNHSEMGVSFKAWLARSKDQEIPKENSDYDNDFTEMWWHRNFYPSIEMIANDLHGRGLLPAGDYVINIDW